MDYVKSYIVSPKETTRKVKEKYKKYINREDKMESQAHKRVLLTTEKAGLPWWSSG